MSNELERRQRRRLAGKYPALFCVRATAEEASRIKQNARKAGRPYTRFLAELGAAEGAPERLPHRPSPVEVEVLEGLMFQLRKVGVNLNQLAHRENSADVGGSALPPTDAELQEAAQAVEETVDLIRERLR
jgi:hypothetical protein